MKAGEQRRWRETPAAVGRDGGRETAGACVARALSGFPGGGFEFLLGPFCVPPKLTFCFQYFFFYIYLPPVSSCYMFFFCLLLLFIVCFLRTDVLFTVCLFVFIDLVIVNFRCYLVHIY